MTKHPRIVPVVLSGGTGTRLWPLSRESFPKQLLALAGEETLLQQTLSRVAGRQVSVGVDRLCLSTSVSFATSVNAD